MQPQDAALQAAELLAGGFACHTSSDHSAGSPLPPSHGKGEEQEVKPRAVFAGSDGCETGETGERLHPILRLGWRPLCSVTCNGLRGEFLGGHDKEMFIRCTSEPYRDLPLIDVGSGGCIMTCSQFERLAGRELCKKWKESIHVVGCGEGSRATLLSWIKRAAETAYGGRAVGSRLWVCWPTDGQFHAGVVAAYNPDNGKHKILYGGRAAEELHLPVELLRGERPDGKASVTEFEGSAVLDAGAGQERRCLPVRRADGCDHLPGHHSRDQNQNVGGSSDSSIGASDGEAGGYRPTKRTRPGVTSDDTPSGAVRAMAAARRGAGLLPDAAGPKDCAAMAAWMHGLVGALYGVLTAEPGHGSRRGLRALAGFQALVALNRGCEATVRGLYEALISRVQWCPDAGQGAVAGHLLDFMEAAVRLAGPSNAPGPEAVGPSATAAAAAVDPIVAWI